MHKHFNHSHFPATRMRRTRMNAWSRRLVAEHVLSVNDLIWPIFVKEGQGAAEPIATMPGVFRHTHESLKPALEEAAKLGIPAVALFPVVDASKKSDDAREAYNADNLVCRTIRHIKKVAPELGVICDVALDPYTSHGHDGLIRGDEIINDETVNVLVQQSLVQAQAGCDVIAPSDMMDGRVGAIRHALEEKGFKNTLILAYAAKYASAFYGPFRDAIGSSSSLGKRDKRTYQMDAANLSEALREVALDLEEGADWVMVKPGMPYLDIVRAVKENFGVPTFVYQVSGEYAMLKAAAAQGMLDGDAAMIEALLAFKRAGADGILTYAAVDIAKALVR